METQRMEAARNRRRREMERRALQHRTAKDQRYRGMLKVCARNMAKDFMKSVRRDTFNEMRDTGLLRDPRQYSLVSHFLPSLQASTMSMIGAKREQEDMTDGYAMNTLRANARNHKDAVACEHKRIKDKRLEEQRIQKEKEEAKRKRREARAAERERKRIQEMRNNVVTDIVNASTILDVYKADTIHIHDVRDPNAPTENVMFVIGGIVTELLITFTCLYDYILANPQNQNFAFTQENFKTFLKELLIGQNFPDGILKIHVNEKQAPEEDEEEKEPIVAETLSDEDFLNHALNLKYVNDYGLRFFLENCKDFGISKDLIKALYETIISIAKTPELEAMPLPQPPEAEQIEGQEPKEVTDEMKQEYVKLVEEIKKKNEEIESENAEKAKLKEKIQIEYRQHNFEENNECCIIKRLRKRLKKTQKLRKSLAAQSNNLRKNMDLTTSHPKYYSQITGLVR